MKLKDLIFENVPEQFEKQVAPTAAGINKVIDSIDDSMHYGVFAKAVAKVLKDEYGSHNIKPFMNILHSELGMNEDNVSEEVKKSFKLSDLTFDIVSDLFGGVGPGKGVSFPYSTDERLVVFDQERFDAWKQHTMRKFGDVTVHLFPEESAYINQVKIEDEKFQAAKTSHDLGKQAWLDKEREAGRSID